VSARGEESGVTPSDLPVFYRALLNNSVSCCGGGGWGG